MSTPARLEVAADSKLPSEVKTARTKDHCDLIRGISDYGTVWVGSIEHWTFLITCRGF